MACEIATCVDLRKEAELYAQFSGLLGGFAFAGLTLLLNLRFSEPLVRERRHAVESAAMALFSSVFGFAMATLITATIAAEEQNLGRTAVEEGIAGTIMAVSGMVLFTGVTLMFSYDRFRSALKFVRLVAGGAIPIIAFEYLIQSVREVEAHRPGPDSLPLLTHFGYLLLAILFIAMLIFLVQRKRVAGLDLARYASIGGSAISLICAILFGVVNMAADTYIPPSFVSPLYLVVILFLLAAGSLCCMAVEGPTQ